MNQEHKLKPLNTKPRQTYLCTQCFLKYAQPPTSFCHPNDKAVIQRKGIYLRAKPNFHEKTNSQQTKEEA
jgi:hypothetical protein